MHGGIPVYNYLILSAILFSIGTFGVLTRKNAIVIFMCVELMLNAVEHGNLAITYEEKSQLIAASNLDAEIERRLSLPSFASRKARLRILNSRTQLQYVICDEGSVFDWAPYLEMSPARAFDTHGRGIAMSRLLSFDAVEYQGCGNQVVATIRY